MRYERIRHEAGIFEKRHRLDPWEAIQLTAWLSQIVNGNAPDPMEKIKDFDPANRKPIINFVKEVTLCIFDRVEATLERMENARGIDAEKRTSSRPRAASRSY